MGEGDGELPFSEHEPTVKGSQSWKLFALRTRTGKQGSGAKGGKRERFSSLSGWLSSLNAHLIVITFSAGMKFDRLSVKCCLSLMSCAVMGVDDDLTLFKEILGHLIDELFIEFFQDDEHRHDSGGDDIGIMPR